MSMALYHSFPEITGAAESTLRPKPLTSMAARARGYRALGELLSRPASHETLDEVRAILGRGPANEEQVDPLFDLRSAVTRASSDDLARAWPSDVSVHRRCGAAEGSARAWACVACELVPVALRSTDLFVMAALAERADWAHRLDRADLAAATRHQRTLFVLEHAAHCLGGLARQLASAGPLLASAGATLTALLAAERS